MDDDLNAIVGQAEEMVDGQRSQYKNSDFVYDASEDLYWNLRDLTAYTAVAVNALVPREDWETEDLPGKNGSVRVVSIKPSSSIARVENDSVVEKTTWWPGKPRIIHDIFVSEGGDSKSKGRRILNTYKAPTHHTKGVSAMAGLWIEHLKRLWPDDWEILLDYFAHTVQHPDVKINYGIVLLGTQGIGKDSALHPVRYAIGEVNCKEISPDELFSNYNSFVNSLMIVINEARPADSDFKARDFYEKLKTLCAAPPDWLLMNGKYAKQRHVRNLMRVIITTNDPLALYVPENDRRLHFAHSKAMKDSLGEGYFKQLWDYYEHGGMAHVYAYLRDRDVSKFNPNAKPAHNAAWNSVVSSWSHPIDSPLHDVLDELGWPNVFFGIEMLSVETASFDNKDDVKAMLKSSRKMAGMMSNLGYDTYQSPNKQSGWQWYEGKSRFKARVAFVKHGYGGDLEGEVQIRGREIALNGVAPRPKVVPISSTRDRK